MSRLNAYLRKYPVVEGYLFAFLATLGMSNVYIFSKAAMSQLDLIPFGFYRFGIALLSSTLYMLISGKVKAIKGLDRRSRVLHVIIGFL